MKQTDKQMNKSKTADTEIFHRNEPKIFLERPSSHADHTWLSRLGLYCASLYWLLPIKYFTNVRDSIIYLLLLHIAFYFTR